MRRRVRGPHTCAGGSPGLRRRDTIVGVALLWLLVAIGLAIAEVFTTTFVLIMFAAGALAAAGTAALGAGLPVQGGVFALVSALALFGVRPVVQRHLHRDTADAPMGLAAIEGSTGVVLERIDSESGLVKIEGEMWRARAFDATQVFEPGDRVQVVEIKGATAMVWRN
jgi:membrane protein implicated in regulation of membrane protease activity